MRSGFHVFLGDWARRKMGRRRPFWTPCALRRLGTYQQEWVSCVLDFMRSGKIGSVAHGAGVARSELHAFWADWGNSERSFQTIIAPWSILRGCDLCGCCYPAVVIGCFWQFCLIFIFLFCVSCFCLRLVRYFSHSLSFRSPCSGVFCLEAAICGGSMCHVLVSCFSLRGP